MQRDVRDDGSVGEYDREKAPAPPSKSAILS
jgi:hypothetical protein